MRGRTRRGGTAIPKLVITSSDGERVAEVSGDRIVVGSDVGCDVVIDADTVSPEHFALQSVMGAWKIVDLESDEGTRVNGAYVNQRPVRGGDILDIGGIRIIFQDDPRPVAPAPEAAPMMAPQPVTVMPTSSQPARAQPQRRAAPATSRPARPSRAAGRRGRSRDEDDYDDDEQPRRYARKKKSNTPVIIAIVVVVLLVFGVVGMGMFGDARTPNERVLGRMLAADKKMDWQTVLREAEAADTSDPAFGPRIIELKKRAAQAIQTEVAAERGNEVTNAWNQIVAWRQDDNWKNDDEYIRRVDAYLNEYAPIGGPAVLLAMKERAKITGSAKAGTATDADDAWQRLQIDTQLLGENGHFGRALTKVDNFISDWAKADATHRKNADNLSEELRVNAKRWMGMRISRSQDKLEQGTAFQARKVLEEAIEVIGIPELEERARQELAKLPAVKRD